MIIHVNKIVMLIAVDHVNHLISVKFVKEDTKYLITMVKPGNVRNSVLSLIVKIVAKLSTSVQLVKADIFLMLVKIDVNYSVMT